MLVFKILSRNYNRVIGKLKPVNGVEEIERETTLAVLIGFYVLDKRIEAHVEQQRTQAIALKNAAANSYKWSTEFGGYDGSLKISIQTCDDMFYVMWNMMIFKDRLD